MIKTKQYLKFSTQNSPTLCTVVLCTFHMLGSVTTLHPWRVFLWPLNIAFFGSHTLFVMSCNICEQLLRVSEGKNESTAYYEDP